MRNEDRIVTAAMSAIPADLVPPPASAWLRQVYRKAWIQYVEVLGRHGVSELDVHTVYLVDVLNDTYGNHLSLSNGRYVAPAPSHPSPDLMEVAKVRLAVISVLKARWLFAGKGERVGHVTRQTSYVREYVHLGNIAELRMRWLKQELDKPRASLSSIKQIWADGDAEYRGHYVDSSIEWRVAIMKILKFNLLKHGMDHTNPPTVESLQEEVSVVLSAPPGGR